MIKNRISAMFLAVVIIFSALLFCACGGKEIEVSVNDAGNVTQVNAKTGTKVEDVLKDAGIELGDKDETEPKKDEQITEDTKEITVKRYAKVTVVQGDKKQETEVVGGKVKDALDKLKITLKEGETVDPPVDTYLKDGMTITVKGADFKVSLTVAGKTSEVSTSAKTVEEFLKEQKVTLGDDDEINVKKTDKITDGMKIIVKKVEYKEETKKEEIDYDTEESYDSSMDAGDSKVTQEGKKGEKEITYKVKYVDGKEDSKEKISEKVTKEPVTKKVTIGTKQEEQHQENNNNNDDNGGNNSNEKTEVSREKFPNCDDDSHGYYEIHYSDGSVEYVEY